MPALQLSNPCVACHTAEASVNARKRWLCWYVCRRQSVNLHAEKYSECFISYISSKPVKRLESYQLKDDTQQQARRLLLPVSGGTSSTVLLQILDRHLQRQLINRGRPVYELLVLMVETPFLATDEHLRKCFDNLKRKFSNHSFSLLSLSNVFDLDESISGDLAILGPISRDSAEASLINLVSSARTASTRTDLLETLFVRLIVAFAKLNNCHAVLWGHSNDRLAAKSLAAVAEGRGGLLPLQISDGLSPWAVQFYYPLRDLVLPELVAFAKIHPERLSELLVHDTLNPMPPKSIRDTSISELLSNYITAQGEKYPSIIANIVRTVNKLQQPIFPSEVFKCSICVMPEQLQDGSHSQADLRDWPPRHCSTCQRSLAEMKPRDNS